MAFPPPNSPPEEMTRNQTSPLGAVDGGNQAGDGTMMTVGGVDLTGHLLGMTMDGVDPRGLAGVSPVGVMISGSRVLHHLDGANRANLASELKDQSPTSQVKEHLLHGGDLVVLARVVKIIMVLGAQESHRGRVPSHLVSARWMKA